MSDVKPGIRGKSLLKQGEDIAEFPDSLPPDQLLDNALTKAGFTGTFAADWFEKKKPNHYRAICFALAKGYPMRDIAYILKVSTGTVQAIAERECDNLPPAKETILAKLKTGSRLAAERVLELMPQLNGHDAVIALGILTDKMLLLSGEANVIVAKQREAPTHEDFNQMINSLPKADAKVVEHTHDHIVLNPKDNQGRTGLEIELNRPIVEQTPAKLTISQTNPDHIK
jgi:hypothetical protein